MTESSELPQHAQRNREYWDDQAAGYVEPGRLAEAARLLRPGGRLVSLGHHSLLMLCEPDTDPVEPGGDRLLRGYFGLRRLEWISDQRVNFALPYGEWFRLLRASGFEIEDLLELQAPADATRDFDFVAADWAKRWPSEHVIKAVKRA